MLTEKLFIPMEKLGVCRLVVMELTDSWYLEYDTTSKFEKGATRWN